MLATDTFVRLCRARDLLREVADRPLTLEDIARDAAMSHFHFIRQFTALFGITPHQYLGSFSAQFAQRAGIAPSRYRQRARSMIVVPGLPPPALFPGCLTLMAAAFATLEKHSRAPSRTLDS